MSCILYPQALKYSAGSVSQVFTDVAIFSTYGFAGHDFGRVISHRFAAGYILFSLFLLVLIEYLIGSSKLNPHWLWIIGAIFTQALFISALNFFFAFVRAAHFNIVLTGVTGFFMPIHCHDGKISLHLSQRGTCM